ncbi:hypothetical protein A6P39_038900 [Streptomyces sp. FXJ1.172]|uniref:hypothetical protein n=1 Tax=Streptomyces sp. FXJ1.172 TaxID=710705 RepID=UPI0007CF688C|nr:hypothetical protein [Streptomyces sp. FXJ1.172]WEO99539.1 hypothetical protein A6P39_038900 [Streptomyces sp. FXJ1.172]
MAAAEGTWPSPGADGSGGGPGRGGLAVGLALFGPWGSDHAIGLAIHSTGAHVSGNRTDPHVRYEVGIDASSRPGYRGPEPGGAP